jgi:hypothetical protein
MALSKGWLPVDNRCDSDSTPWVCCDKNDLLVKIGVLMLRLTILLCFGMLVALFTLGEDRGQLRPGLAEAEAEGRLDEVWAEARAKAEPVAPPMAEPVAIVADVAPVPEPEPAPVAAAPVAMADTGPVIEVEAGREVVQSVEEPVFSLTSFGNEPVPGEDGAPIETAIAEAIAEPAAEEAPAGGTIWYVTADSVNVRAGPSTDAEVLGRLGSGEAALLVTAVDSDWARIVIQGDGVEGYVAMRYLSPTSP